MTEAVVVSDYGLVREAYRSKHLRQALYDEGAVVMADCLLTLHGEAHRARRRLENRLFRRDVFARWERELLRPVFDGALAPFLAAGNGDLMPIGYRTTVNLTAHVAGVDRPAGTAEETDALHAIVKTLSEGATMVHSTRDRDELRAEVAETLERFDRLFLQPSIDRRRELIARERSGLLAEAELPSDVLTTLLRNADHLDLPAAVIRREIAFYLQAGSHSTANAFTHTLDELWSWSASHPEDLERARSDPFFLQRCVHETLRLNPASPVAWRRPLIDLALSDGTMLAEGQLVVLDLGTANRDPSLFGSDADRFNPHRTVAEGTPAWGHSFGGGVHACIGMELDGGLEPGDAGTADEHLFGTVAVMVERFLAHGGRPDPQRPPSLDPGSSRRHFSSYPVLLG